VTTDGKYSRGLSPWSGREGVRRAVAARAEASVTTSGAAEAETETERVPFGAAGVTPRRLPEGGEGLGTGR
jgi:hypothetical protein